MKCDELCKYNAEGYGCTFPDMGNGYPKYAPCYHEQVEGVWMYMDGPNRNMADNYYMCSECKQIVPKDWVRNCYYEDPLLFKYCPNCGAKMSLENRSKKRIDDMKWNNTDIDVVEIDGALYALNGWNGEKYLHCWKCIDRFTADPDGREYEITPVYDWSKWNEEDGEFQGADGNAIDGIIGYEVTA